MHRGAPGEALPTSRRHIEISGVELYTVAGAAGHFGRDQARARTEKRVIDGLAGPAVVDDRAAHAFDRLLGAVPPALLALPVAERIVVGDLPDRRLCAVALPVAGPAFAQTAPVSTSPDPTSSNNPITGSISVSANTNQANGSVNYQVNNTQLTSQGGCVMLEAISVSHGKASPYLPVIELLKTYFQIQLHDEERQRIEQRRLGSRLHLLQGDAGPFVADAGRQLLRDCLQGLDRLARAGPRPGLSLDLHRRYAVVTLELG